MLFTQNIQTDMPEQTVKPRSDTTKCGIRVYILPHLAVLILIVLKGTCSSLRTSMVRVKMSEC